MYRETTLGEIAHINPPRPKIELGPDTKVSFIPMGDVTEGGRWSGRQVRPFKEVSRGYTAFAENDVLFAKITPCMENGKGALVTGLQNGVGFGSTEFHVLRAKPNCDPGFLFQWTIYEPFRRKAAATMTGSAGQQRVPASVLEMFRIPEIAKPEQTKIAEILSTVDVAIEQTEALLAKQHRLRSGLIHDVLTGGIDDNGNVRNVLSHRFKDSPLGRIPVEWDVAPIHKHGSKDQRYLRTGPFGTALNTRHWVEDGIPVLTIGSLGEGEVLESELLYVSAQTAAALRGFRVRPGDIVISRVADIGRSLVIGDSQEGWILSSNLMRVSLNQETARPAYLYRNIAYNPAIRSQLRASANSGGRDLVNGEILSSLLFPWPGVHEQDRINEVLDSADELVQASQRQLKNLMATKTGLMQDLLTGRKPVTPLLTPTEDTSDDRGENP